jgi:ribonucleoside-diphosphate reductase alpha chain
LLAREKGSFAALDLDKYMQSKYVQQLEPSTKNMILEHGIRNSHLISIAPTGTISMCADNISSGIEPVFAHSYDRTVLKDTGASIETIQDWGYANGVKGKTSGECSIDDHLSVLEIASRWSDSAVSKTINVGDSVTWNEFKDVYMRAWKSGCKGCTTFRAAGKRYGILNAKSEERVKQDTLNTVAESINKIIDDVTGSACYYDPATGKKTCE